MTPEYTNQLAAQLLLSGLATVLALGIASCLAIIYFRSGRAEGALHRMAGAASHSEEHACYQPSVFEQPCRWLVVKSSHPGAVQSALGLHNPTPCSWGEGLSRLTTRKLFVSAPVRGWILVIGQGLPDPADDVDRCFHFLRSLSRSLGQIQFFSGNRALNHHAWIRVDRGQIRRAYAWAGETLWNQGQPTPAEIELGMKSFPYGEGPESLELTGKESQSNNSEKLLSLAARWSFDPTAVNESMLRRSWGVAGDVVQTWRQ